MDRGLCLGGGGLFFVAWQVSYLQTLAGLGVRFDDADKVVGTSAGSIVASTLVAGKLKRLHSEVSLLSKFPALVSALAPASTLSPSQQRALDLFIKATDGEPSTLVAAATPSAAATSVIIDWCVYTCWGPISVRQTASVPSPSISAVAPPMSDAGPASAPKSLGSKTSCSNLTGLGGETRCK